MNSIEIYQADNGAIEFRGDSSLETIWASLDQIAELFQRDKSGISRHIRNIYKNEELEKEAVVAKIATTASDGKTYQVEYYNLDMILSIGYRVDSKEATYFRKWASSILKKYLVNGYAVNEKKLTQTKEELDILRSKISTTKFTKTRTLPKAFTEKGLYMLATIPEAIKMALLVKEFQKDTTNFETKVCVTAQHRESRSS